MGRLPDDIFQNGLPIPGEVMDGDPLSVLYGIFLSIGVLLVVIVSAIQLSIKKIPLNDFFHAIYICLPIGVVGGSVFGKLFTSDQAWKFWELFFFWNPGMSFFGAMFAGGTAAFVWFSYKCKYSRISIYVYADCIVPNILLGQAIGRWGNLFNHEIMGKPVDVEQINWLPRFIWHRLFYYVDPSTGEGLKELQFHQPLFLYESFATLLSWVLITFIIANFGKWFSKKPWKLDPTAFPMLLNNQYKYLPLDEIKSYPTQIPIEYIPVYKKIDEEKKVIGYKLSIKQSWYKAYYLYEPSSIESEKLQQKIYEHKLERELAEKKYVQVKSKKDFEIEQLKLKLNKNKISKQDFNLEKVKINKKYLEELNKLKKEKSHLLNFLSRDCKDLYKLNNPNNYFVIHCGVKASVYIMFIAIIRIILDSFRSPYELAVKNLVILNYLSLVGILLLGLLLFIFAQFISPKKWREEGWLYEKSY